MFVDELSQTLSINREAKITYPDVERGHHEDLPAPVLFHCAVGDSVRFKGPDASMVTLTLNSSDFKGGLLKLENNKSPIQRQLYETFVVKISGQRVLLQAHPGPDDALRLYALLPDEIAVVP